MTKLFSLWDYTNLMFKEGEYPTPTVMNRPMVVASSIGEQLDEALQFLCRSNALETTNKTCFLSHCAGDGIDNITLIEPKITNGTVADVFVADGFFYGGAYVQTNTTNLLSTADGSFATLTGWTVTGDGAGGTGAAVTVGADGITVDTTGEQTVATGTVGIVSALFSLTAGQTIVTYSALMATLKNIARMDVVVEIGISFCGADGLEISTDKITGVPSPYTGLLAKEKAAVPPTATQAKFFINVTYPTNGARCVITFKNAMVDHSPYYRIFTLASRNATALAYDEIVDTDNDAVSVVYWAKYPSGKLASHISPCGSLFLIDGDGFYTGAVHKAASGSAFKLSYFVGSGSTTVAEGSEVTLPAESLDVYLPCMLRYSKTKDLIEFVIADTTLTLHKSSVPYSTLPDVLDVSVGYGGDQTEQFDGGVTDIRVDNEWLNDFAFLVIAMARHPFGRNAQISTTAPGSAEIDVFKLQPLNMIPNPQGALSLNYWSGYPASGFDSIASGAGQGFLYTGGATAEDISIGSDPIPVTGGEVYTLYGLVVSAEDSVGEFGIGIRFFASDKTTATSILQTLSATAGNTSTYSMMNSTAPGGSYYAKVYMYLKAGADSDSIFWTRLKLAPIDGVSIFTDDATGGAVYA